MKRYINITSLIFCLIIVLSCSTDDDNNITSMIGSVKSSPLSIDISTYRNIENIDSISLLTKSSGDPLIQVRNVETSESIVLPELLPHVWLGNIIKKSSVADLDYKPLTYQRNPIRVGLTLPGTTASTINNPSFITIGQYVESQTQKGNFSQNQEFNFSVEQFTSYNELKSSFGSNKDVSGLFWGYSTEEGGQDITISKSTGLIVRFYQTSFKAIMDYPQNGIASIPENEIDEAVYMNSIAYGRLGVLTLETDSSVNISKEYINKIFKSIFINNSTNFTKEEKDFLQSCDFKVYLVAGNGISSAQSFTGLTGFLNHIKKGTFSKNEPGVPIFVTYAHARDNAPLLIKFTYNIKIIPVYVEMTEESLESSFKNLYLTFYKNSSKIPTIAPSFIQFVISHRDNFVTYQPDFKETISYEDIKINNSGHKTALKVVSRARYNQSHSIGNVDIWDRYHSYTLKESPYYRILGTKKFGWD